MKVSALSRVIESSASSTRACCAASSGGSMVTWLTSMCASALLSATCSGTSVGEHGGEGEVEAEAEGERAALLASDAGPLVATSRSPGPPVHTAGASDASGSEPDNSGDAGPTGCACVVGVEQNGAADVGCSPAGSCATSADCAEGPEGVSCGCGCCSAWRPVGGALRPELDLRAALAREASSDSRATETEQIAWSSSSCSSSSPLALCVERRRRVADVDMTRLEAPPAALPSVIDVDLARGGQPDDSREGSSGSGSGVGVWRAAAAAYPPVTSGDSRGCRGRGGGAENTGLRLRAPAPPEPCPSTLIPRCSEFCSGDAESVCAESGAPRSC